MNVNVLIDAIVRQNMVLIAQLATAAGMRSPLAHVANQVFLDLVGELQAQGLSQKVIADMFGLALRTYHAKVRRLSESATDRGRSLWEAVLSYIQEEGLVFRADILMRFSRDDAMTVKGVLNDLVETGLVFRTGRGDRTAYRAASAEDLGVTEEVDPIEGAINMAWVAIHRNQPTTLDDISQFVALSGDDLNDAIERLEGDGRIKVDGHDEEGKAIYSCDECVIPYGTAAGWEGAVFDHYQAMVTAICTKLQQGRNRALPRDAVGGSTYGFDVWKGHPMEKEVLEFLSTIRDQASGLRKQVDTYNASLPPQDDEEDDTREPMRVIFYAGQAVLMDEPQENGR